MTLFARRRTVRLATLALFAAGPALLAAAPAPALAADAPPRVITVTGEAEVKAVPDEAMLSAGVVSRAATAAAALAENRRAMNAVFAELKARGIPDRSIQTSGFSVSPQYDQGRNGNGPQRLIGYEVTNNVAVVVDDLAHLGETLDALVNSGANSLGDVSFAVRDPKPLEEQARAAAVKDALARAQTLANAAGVTLGPVLTIDEGGAPGPHPVFAMARMEAVASPAPTPIAAGESTITENVSLTVAIQ